MISTNQPCKNWHTKQHVSLIYLLRLGRKIWRKRRRRRTLHELYMRKMMTIIIVYKSLMKGSEVEYILLIQFSHHRCPFFHFYFRLQFFLFRFSWKNIWTHESYYVRTHICSCLNLFWLFFLIYHKSAWKKDRKKN